MSSVPNLASPMKSFPNVEIFLGRMSKGLGVLAENDDDDHPQPHPDAGNPPGAHNFLYPTPFSQTFFVAVTTLSAPEGKDKVQEIASLVLQFLAVFFVLTPVAILGTAYNIYGLVVSWISNYFDPSNPQWKIRMKEHANQVVLEGFIAVTTYCVPILKLIPAILLVANKVELMGRAYQQAEIKIGKQIDDMLSPKQKSQKDPETPVFKRV